MDSRKAGMWKSTLAKMVRTSLAPGGTHDESYTTADSEVYGSNTGLKSDWRSTVYDGVSRDICADYFYSSRGGINDRSPKWMLQAFLYQVLGQNPTLLSSFRAAFQKSRKLGHNWTYVLLQEVFITLSSVSNQRTYLTPRLYLIIDAPDESESYEGVDRTEVLDFLLQLCSPLPGRNPACIFKVLLISRPASDIETTLRGVSSIRMHEQTKRDIEHIVDAGLSLIIKKLERNSVQDDEGSDSDYESSDDIDKKAKISKIPLQTFPIQGQPHNMNISDLSFVRDYLIQNANRVILWVVLILKDLEQTFNTGFWSLKEIKEMLTSLPRDLEQWYVEMIRRIIQDTEREFQKRNYPKHQRLAKTKLMLSWATFAKRAMTIEEF